MMMNYYELGATSFYAANRSWCVHHASLDVEVTLEPLARVAQWFRGSFLLSSSLLSSVPIGGRPLRPGWWFIPGRLVARACNARPRRRGRNLVRAAETRFPPPPLRRRGGLLSRWRPRPCPRRGSSAFRCRAAVPRLGVRNARLLPWLV